MTELKQILAEAADEARSYNVTEVVVRRARRRRLLTRLTPAAAALLAGAVLLSAPVLPDRDAQTAAPVVVDATGPAQDGQFDGVPTRLPDIATAPLPADRAVGRAAFLLCPRCLSDESPLVTRDGRIYDLSSGPNPVFGDHLSPDGRWLAWVGQGESEGMSLRDLTGTVDRRFGRYTVVGWSPDGRAVALEPQRPLSDRPYAIIVVDLDTLTTREFPLRDPTRWSPVALLPSGDMVFVPAAPTTPDPASPDRFPGSPSRTTLATPSRGDGLFYAVADGVTGAVRPLDVPLAEVLARDETVATRHVDQALHPVVSRDGEALFIQVLRTFERGSATLTTAGDILEISLKSGAVVRRIRLPAADAADSPALFLKADTPDGLVLRGRGVDGSTIQLLDQETGRRQVISHLGHDTDTVVLPGQVVGGYSTWPATDE